MSYKKKTQWGVFFLKMFIFLTAHHEDIMKAVEDVWIMTIFNQTPFKILIIISLLLMYVGTFWLTLKYI